MAILRWFCKWNLLSVTVIEIQKLIQNWEILSIGYLHFRNLTYLFTHIKTSFKKPPPQKKKKYGYLKPQCEKFLQTSKFTLWFDFVSEISCFLSILKNRPALPSDSIPYSKTIIAEFNIHFCWLSIDWSYLYL